METYVEKLSKVTFSVHHSPSCPKPFQVRLVGAGVARLDNLQRTTTKDICGHGQTLEEAAKEAWQKKIKLISKRQEMLKKKYGRN